MKIPKNLNEDEVITTLTMVGNKLASQFTFGYYDEDDIRQEIFIIGLESLEGFDKDKGCLYTFLLNNVKNRLINLKRDKSHRPNPPKKFDKEGNTYKKWKKRNDDKKNICSPMNVSTSRLDSSYDVDLIDKINHYECMDIINENLSVEYRGDFKRFMEGVSISKYKREKVIQVVTEILEGYIDD